MQGESRSQDMLNAVLGMILIVLPFVLGAQLVSGVQFAAWGIGGLVALVAMYLLNSPQNVKAEWAQVILGILLVISPWVLGFDTVTPMAWSAWIIGVLVVITSTSVLLSERGEALQR